MTGRKESLESYEEKETVTVFSIDSM